MPPVAESRTRTVAHGVPTCHKLLQETIDDLIISGQLGLSLRSYRCLDASE